MAPINPEIGRGLISAGGSVLSGLLGGVLGNKAQQDANKLNLQIARETNQANRDIATQANQLTRQLQLEQMKYASPAEQRKMLEAAGYNPYLYGSQSAHPSSSPAAAVGNAQIAPTMMPVNSLASNISNLSSDMANVFNTFAQGRKANAEADATNIENTYKVDMLEQTLRLMGLQEEADSIKNSYLNQKESLSVEDLQNAINIKGVQLQDLELAYKVRSEYLPKMTEKEFEKLKESVNLLREEGLTQKSLRNYYDSAASAGMISANATKLLAFIKSEMLPWEIEESKSRTTKNVAEAGVASQEYVSKDMQNAVYKLTGQDTALAELRRIIKSGNLNDAMTEKAYKETDYLRKTISWYEYQQIVGGFKNVVSAGGEGALLIKLLGL